MPYQDSSPEKGKVNSVAVSKAQAKVVETTKKTKAAKALMDQAEAQQEKAKKYYWKCNQEMVDAQWELKDLTSYMHGTVKR